MRHIPNILTFSRIALLPIYLQMLWAALFYPSTETVLAAFGWLSFLALTDKLDGYFAKRNNGAWQTPTGKILDPIADKLMFWASMLVIVAWFCYNDQMRLPTLVLIPVLSLHAHLDIESTRLRSVDGEGAKTRGQLKFCMDLLAIALTLVVAWGSERNPETVPAASFMIIGALALATALAHQNVQSRQKAKTLML